MLMNTENWASLEKRFSSEIANWRSGGNVICMAIGDLGKFKGKDTYYLKPLQIALMNVDENWIPADSSYELTMLNYLHKHERSFIKPLRYDASNNDVFPDFCLTDIGGMNYFLLRYLVWILLHIWRVRRSKKVTIMNDMERMVGHHGLPRLAPYPICPIRAAVNAKMLQ